jgi:osmotically-inducible protein OsmY
VEASQIRVSLAAALENEPRVNLHRDRIDVQFADNVATVSGEVSDIAAKRLTLEIAAALPAVHGVVDRLRVRPAETMGDGAITDHVEHALISDSAFADCALYRQEAASRVTVRLPAGRETRWWIAIQAEEGIVTLDGEVPSLSHKRLAGALAWWVPGSRDVINGLGVEPAEEDTDEEILDALRLVLDRDPFIDASQIHARCRDSVITLEGLVSSDSQRSLAEYDAWALFGVDQVINRVAVRAD